MTTPIEKFIKDGKVAVVYSTGFGAGWYTWNLSDENSEHLLFDKIIVENVLKNDMQSAYNRAEEICPDGYIGSQTLAVEWLPVGTKFRIDEYDGSEAVEIMDNIHWIEA